MSTVLNLTKNTRENIISAAGILFASSGFAATSMDKIAAAVGIKKATLYHYFQNKEALLTEILNVMFEKISQRLDEVAEQNISPLEKLRNAIQTLISFSNSNQDVHIFSILAASVADKRKIAQIVLDKKRKLFIKIKKLIISIDPCADQSPQTASLISLTILGMVVNSHITQAETEIAKDIDHLMTIIKCYREHNLT